MTKMTKTNFKSTNSAAGSSAKSDTFTIDTSLYPALCLATKAMRNEINRMHFSKKSSQYQLYKRFWDSPKTVALRSRWEINLWHRAIMNYEPINAEEQKISNAMKFDIQKYIIERETPERAVSAKTKSAVPVQA